MATPESTPLLEKAKSTMADVIDVAKNKTKAPLIIALIVAAAIVLILWAAGVFKSHEKSKSKFSASSGITSGLRTSDPNNQQTNLVNHGVGSYAIHQGSLATGGLFEHDIESVWQQAPMRTNLNRANAHCEPGEIEGTSFVHDVSTGNLVRVVSCYDRSGIHIPKPPKKNMMQPMANVLPPVRGKQTKSRFEGFAGGELETFGAETFASSPSIDCNGVWDYGAEGELGSQVLMSNMVAYNSMGEDKLEKELLDME